VVRFLLKSFFSLFARASRPGSSSAAPTGSNSTPQTTEGVPAGVQATCASTATAEVTADVGTSGAATSADPMAPNAAAADAPVPGAATPDAVSPEALAMAADVPTPGLVTANIAAGDAATTSTLVPVSPTSVLDAPTPSSHPAAEEELDVVSGRRLLQGPLEEDAVPLPRVLVRVRRTIEESTSTAEAAFRWEWTALESELQRLGDWHIRLEERTKAEASCAAAARSELEADLETYRKGLRKVFDQELATAGLEKALEQREEAIAKEEVSLAARGSELETRSLGLEVRRQELNELSESLHRWRLELLETASQQAVAEMDLEEERKSLARRESLTTSMERSLERQRESFKTRHEKAAQK